MMSHQTKMLLIFAVAIIAVMRTISQSCSVVHQLNDCMKEGFDVTASAIRPKNVSDITSISTNVDTELVGVVSDISTSSQAMVSYEDLVRHLNNETLTKRVVILAGPHKTGSTSLQNNFHKWTGSDNYLLDKWAWPVPAVITKYESEDENHWQWNPSKGFYALAELLRDNKHSITDRLVFQKSTREELLQSYKTEFLRAWSAGYNLIIGSEAFDNVIKDDDDEMIERLLALMPWNLNEGVGNDRITVVVTYRVPRVKHLISVWRETKKDNQSFKEWILKTKNELGAIDSLGLVEMFLKKGLNVVLADINGIGEAGHDISNVIACEVLQARCTDERQLVGSDPPLIMNTKENFRGHLKITNEQMDKMDAAMRSYDCKYVNLFKEFEEKNQLVMLHATSLSEVLESCQEGDGEHTSDRIKMKSELVCIVQGKDDCTSREEKS